MKQLWAEAGPLEISVLCGGEMIVSKVALGGKVASLLSKINLSISPEAHGRDIMSSIRMTMIPIVTALGSFMIQIGYVNRLGFALKAKRRS